MAVQQLEQHIATNGTQIIKQFVTNFAYNLSSNLMSSLSSILYVIQHGIGRCQPLYNSIQLVTTSVCYTFLNPFNGYWFSLGWCLAFCIPTLIIALYLATLYQAVDEDYKLSSRDSKSFDEHVRRRRGRVHPVSGHHNVVYEPDINPPPPATLYSPPRNIPSLRSAGSTSPSPGIIHPTYYSLSPDKRGLNFHSEY
jgi:hypothetical protein